MTTTINEIDWEKVQSIIDTMRNQSDEVDPLQTFTDNLQIHLSQFGQLSEDGFPYQEIVFDASEAPLGIPVELAYMLLAIFEFCAYSNIDLGGAIRMIQQNV